MGVFTKKVATTKTEPSFDQLGATDKMRRMLITNTRRRSMLTIAKDVNDIIGERANRALAKSVAANMAGPGAPPDVVTALAKSTFANLPASNVKINLCGGPGEFLRRQRRAFQRSQDCPLRIFV
jgi:hypothetical protein